MRPWLALLVIGAIFVGVLAVGTPVAGNDSVAAVTAGINLGTSPATRPGPSASIAVAPTPVRAAVLTLLLALALIVLPGERPPDPLASDPSSRYRFRAHPRRGPPAA